jgi:hypothetical protein
LSQVVLHIVLKKDFMNIHGSKYQTNRSIFYISDKKIENQGFLFDVICTFWRKKDLRNISCATHDLQPCLP